MLEHLYSPQMSDIFVRLLNFSRSVFEDDIVSEGEDQRAPSVTETAAQDIRQCTIFSII